MRIFSGLMMAVLITQASYATDCSLPMRLDKVTFQLSSKLWVSTQTALLSVNINATLNSTDVVKARASMMEKLAKIVPGDWHMVQFERSQDSSGLEKLDAVAQVRVNHGQLTHVYQAAKDLSKPGETYQVTSVEFKPSLEDIQKAKASLRQTLNKQIQQELAQLNQSYTEQHFTISAVEYVEDAEPAASQEKPMLLMAAAGRTQRPVPLAIGSELIMTAMVEAGSVRK